MPAIVLCLVGCEQATPELSYRVVRTLPHDPLAYTQGLVLHDGSLFESTGRYGTSSVRKVRPETGEILQIHQLPEEYFGEGLAVVGSQLIQLTWKAGLAFVYDLDSLDIRQTFEYSGEGWGLCFDGESLFMSDGSSTLFRRDPETFEVTEQLTVSTSGFSVPALNELECVGDHIYANVFRTNRILRIDKATGQVLAEMDGFRLSLASKRVPNPDAVMNGIAFDSVAGTLLVTGKLWPDMFEIELLNQ